MAKSFPSQLGFRMPAEWEPHASTWLVWPESNSTWSGALLKKAETVYIRIIQALLGSEKVNVLVKDEKKARAIVQKLNLKKSVHANLVFHEAQTADVWIRDYGPLFVKSQNGSAAFTKWDFNAWGEKYDDLVQDDGVIDRLGALHGYRRFDTGMVMEGGSIDVNGKGACLTTEQCLLNPNRNPKLSRHDIEEYLERYLGVKKVVWLKGGIKGDDTDGHVDEISRFVSPTTVLTVIEKDPRDENFHVLKENLEILKAATDQNGKRLSVIELPMPGKIRPVRKKSAHDRFPASYANFYIANKTVLVPVFGDKNDKLALKIIKGVFPKRKILPINCTAIAQGRGSIHCITQQEPR